MNKCRFESLAGDLAAGDDFMGSLAQSGVRRGHLGSGFVLLAVIFFAVVKDDGNQAIGFEFGRGGRRKIRIHKFGVSSVSMAERWTCKRPRLSVVSEFGVIHRRGHRVAQRKPRGFSVSLCDLCGKSDRKSVV